LNEAGAKEPSWISMQGRSHHDVAALGEIEQPERQLIEFSSPTFVVLIVKSTVAGFSVSDGGTRSMTALVDRVVDSSTGLRVEDLLDAVISESKRMSQNFPTCSSILRTWTTPNSLLCLWQLARGVKDAAA
jgi:hypothetical protein